MLTNKNMEIATKAKIIFCFLNNSLNEVKSKNIGAKRTTKTEVSSPKPNTIPEIKYLPFA